MNLMMLLEMASSGFADRVAVTDGDDATALTYAELFAAAGAAARRVQEQLCRKKKMSVRNRK